MHALKACQTFLAPLGTPRNQAKAPAAFFRFVLQLGVSPLPSSVCCLLLASLGAQAPSPRASASPVSASRSFQVFSKHFPKKQGLFQGPMVLGVGVLLEEPLHTCWIVSVVHTGLSITAAASHHHLEMVLAFTLAIVKGQYCGRSSQHVRGTYMIAATSLSDPLLPGMLQFIAGVTIKPRSKEPVAVPRSATEALRSLGPGKEGIEVLMTCGCVT